MKHRSIHFLMILFAAVTGFLSSCSKDDDVPTVAKPEISTLEIGTGDSKTVVAGSDLHFEGEITAEGLIDKIEIEIHQEDGGTYELTETYDSDTYKGKKNATFHEHLDIPAAAPAGDYHLHFTVTDQAGNSTTVESELTIEAATTQAAYKLVFTEVSAEPHNDHFDDVTNKADAEPITVSFDENGSAIAEGHIHLNPTGIYRIDFKEYNAAGEEIQGQYIASKAVADKYKVFLTGGSFILNTASANGTGAIFQTKETAYGDGTAISAATETTGITSYFTAGADNEGEKEVTFVLREFSNTTTKASVTRTDWNLADYATKFAGEDLVTLEFEIHAETGEED